MPTSHEAVTRTLDRMVSHADRKSADARHSGRTDALKAISTGLGQSRDEWLKLHEPKALASEKDQKDYARYAKALAKGLPELENGIIDAVKAFEGGDPYAEAESVLNICSTLVSTFGALTGPEGAAVGKLLGSLLGMISTVLGLFEPKKPSLLDQIENLLKQEQAKDEIRQLKVALADFDAFEEVWRAGYWNPVNLQNGPEIRRVREASFWLKSSDNQTDALRDLWFQLLETQAKTFIEVVKSVPLALDALNKQDLSPYQKRNEAGLLIIGLQSAQRMQLAFLKDIVPILQDRGIFWYIGTNGVFYCANYCTDYHEKPNPSFRKIGGSGLDRMSITQSATASKANPRLYVFGLSGGRIYYGHMNWPSGGVEDFRELPIEDSAGCSDIWAVCDDSDPGNRERICFYTAHSGKEIRGYVLGENNVKGECKIAWRKAVDKVTSIRVISYPKSVPGDPEESPENPSLLSDISWIVYGECKLTSTVFAWASNGKSGFIQTQDPGMWGDGPYESIAVDKHHLWITQQDGGWLTSHTSVMKALNNSAQPSRPNWFIGRGARQLSPCDDGSLFRVIGDRVTFKPYTIQAGSEVPCVILRDNWTDLPDLAKQVQKLPNYDWPLIGGLIRNLEKKVAIPAPTA